jgi:hypothetical protein
VGLDAKTQDDIANLNQKRVKTMMTVDELRAEDDLEPLPDGKGEIILDPTWLQFVQGKEAAEQGEEPGGFGAPGAEGDQGGDEEGKTYGDVDFESLLAEAEGDEDEEEGNEKAKKSMRPGTLVVDLTL